jgi:hypothetical protein
MKQPMPHMQAQIRDLIQRHFDLEEFRDLCFRLGVSYDDLRGENLPGRIRDLVLRLNRERAWMICSPFAPIYAPKWTGPTFPWKLL